MSQLCQGCQNAPATVHLTDIKPSGEATERHLCEMCAVKEGIAAKGHTQSNVIVSELLKQGVTLRALAERVCPECGASFKDFHDQGLLGCPHDYTAFRDLLMPIIQRAQDGAVQHVGKVPREAGATTQRKARVAQLQRALREAVKNEEYERAARLRDQIHSLDASDS